ncbi:hypothetical protein N9B89_02520 [Flavobacteriales bacterium]|jgi:hypothetical protein|nr:hypothetical protein [Flavobacteriales bacterium]
MKNLLNILGIILFSITIISCVNNENNENNENSDKQQQIKPINDGNVEKGLMSSNVSSDMESIATSYTFDRKTRTVTEITFKVIGVVEESSGCAEVLKLANDQNIVFKSSKISVENRSNEFDRKVSGELHFADSKMQATLLFNVKGNNKGSTTLLGSIILSSDNFKKSSSDITVYVKGKSK